MPTTKKISKAQLRRDKSLLDRITTLINSNLRDFQDLYLKDYADFKMDQLKSEVNFYRTLIEDPERLRIWNIGKKRIYDKDQIEYNFLRPALYNMKYPTIRMMGFLNEAKENFDTKVKRVIETVFQYRPNINNLRIEKIGDVGHKFSFLISDEDMEIHARVIYVNGVVVCPHYRFIVTKRNK